ncbi:MFS transporter [Paraburkholderia sp. SIMBA_049]
MIDKVLTGSQDDEVRNPSFFAPYSNKERGIILMFSFLGTVFDGADFSVFLFFMVPIARQLHVSIVDVSVVQAISYVMGILGGILFGMLADRRGRRLGLAATVATFGIFTFLTAFANNFSTLLLFRSIAGIGIGGEAGIAFAYVNEAFPGRQSRRGLISSLVQTMFLVGIWLTAWVYSATTAAYGSDAWRWAFGYLGLAAVLSAAVRTFMPESRLWLATRSDRNQVAENAPLVAMFRNGLASRVVGATVMLSFCFYGAYAGVTYAPAMWQTVYHLPAAVIGKLGMLGSFAAAISYIVGGALSDWKGRRWAFVVTTCVGLFAYLIFLLSVTGVLGSNSVSDATAWSAPVVLAYMATQFGYGALGIWGVWLSELFPTQVRTTAQNFVYYTSRAIGGGIAPLAGLMVSQKFGLGLEYAVAFGILGPLVALVLWRALPETRGEALSR